MIVRGTNYPDISAADIDASVLGTGVTIGYQIPEAELDITFPDGSRSYFEPLQFHFHSPSEHTVEGRSYDLEVHFVHYYKGSNAYGQSVLLGAVLGIFFDTRDNTPNAFLDSLWDSVDYARYQYFTGDPKSDDAMDLMDADDMTDAADDEANADDEATADADDT